MAVKKNAECEIIIKVETGTTSTGKASYSSRSFGYINPSLAEDDILDIGQKIAGLQKYNLGSVNRSGHSRNSCGIRKKGCVSPLFLLNYSLDDRKKTIRWKDY